jgi:transposase
VGFLTDEQRLNLRKRLRSERDKRHAYRINVLLLLDAGWTHQQIADALFLDDSTVRDYEQQYRTDGLDALLSDEHRGGTAKLTQSQERELDAHVDAHLYSTAAEVCAHIEVTYGVSYTEQGVRDLLERLGFTYKKTKLIPGKADAEKQEAFLVQMKALKAKMAENDELCYLDGVHPQHNSKPANGWIKKGKEKQLLSNTGRERININGALNPRNHDVIFREDKSINAESTIKLFVQLEGHYPNAPNIYAIADNAKYYRNKAVKAYLGTSRIRLIFLPPYSPNLNLIERLWKHLKKQRCNNKYYEKFAEFKTAILSFLENIGDEEEALRTLLTENFRVIGVQRSET